MDIIIGRDAASSRLSITKEGKTMLTGPLASVPQSVSRQHVKLTIQGDGSLLLTNLKPTNMTFVDGQPIMAKTISQTSKVELGAERYQVDLSKIISAVAPDLITKPEKPVFSLKPLQPIWEKYEQDLLNLQIEQTKRANRQRLQGILSLSATLLAVIPGLPQVIRFIVIGAALIVAVVSFVQSSKTTSSFAVKKNELDHQMQLDYVCPNPDCHAFKGNVPYVQLRNLRACTTCQCKYSS